MILVTPFIVFGIMDLMEMAIDQGIWSAIVIGIYLIISKIIDSYIKIRKYETDKEKEKHQITINEKLINSIADVADFIKNTTKETLDNNKEKCSNNIKNSFKSFANSIIKFGTETIIINNIKINKANIIDNIDHLINNEYYTLYSSLLLYSTNDNKLIDYIKIEWKKELKQTLIDIIYNDELTKEQKLYNINNKINIKINDYCTYVTNKYLEYEH